MIHNSHQVRVGHCAYLIQISNSVLKLSSQDVDVDVQIKFY